jgi:hypothetical protein
MPFVCSEAQIEVLAVPEVLEVAIAVPGATLTQKMLAHLSEAQIEMVIAFP